MTNNNDSKVVLEGRNVSKDFFTDDVATRVIFDINVKIYNGQLCMIIGPSGCGKTTLISILSGILSTSEGEILIMNHNLKEYDDATKVHIRRDNIGFVFQQYNLIPALTVAENAALPLLIKDDQKINYDMSIEKAIKILSTIGMKDHVNKLPKQLSGGQQQRVAIARALIHDPRIIICDEPTAALDKNTGLAVMQILKDIVVKSNGTKAVVVITHDNRIYHFADRLLTMSDGRIIGDYIGNELNDKIEQLSGD